MWGDTGNEGQFQQSTGWQTTPSLWVKSSLQSVFVWPRSSEWVFVLLFFLFYSFKVSKTNKQRICNRDVCGPKSLNCFISGPFHRKQSSATGDLNVICTMAARSCRKFQCVHHQISHQHCFWTIIRGLLGVQYLKRRKEYSNLYYFLIASVPLILQDWYTNWHT